MIDATAKAVAASPRETATHIALSALEALTAAQPDVPPTVEALCAHALAIAGDVALPPKELDDALGEM